MKDGIDVQVHDVGHVVGLRYRHHHAELMRPGGHGVLRAF